ncbi:RNA polymerase sigma factor [Saccharothrix syringae]|uniref:RNA polymerase sigma factor n=1 Tax=Saccharothrix syringae TaxID=103733 RepID=UPI0005273C06|nr:sigma-70 family RNA polymerase sigma factor [Saccharothrix syringae]
MTNPHDAQRHVHEREFAEFYRETHDKLCRYVHHHAPMLDSREIAHVALSRVWGRWGRIEGSPLRYAFIVAKNLMVQELRQTTAPPVSPDERHRLLVAPLEDIEQRQRLLEVEAAIEKLPRHLRDALRMKSFGFSNKQIAEAMGCRTRSVSNYVAEARRRLLARDDPGAGTAEGDGAVRYDDRGDT